MTKNATAEHVLKISFETKRSWKLIFSLLLLSLMLFGTYFGTPGSVWNFNRLGVLFLGVICSAIWFWILYRLFLRPTVLTIDSEGIVDDRLFGAVGRISWTDVRCVGDGVFQIEPFGPSSYIYIDLIDESRFRKNLSIFNRVLSTSNKLGTSHSLVIPSWGFSLQTIEIVEECRKQLQRRSIR